MATVREHTDCVGCAGCGELMFMLKKVVTTWLEVPSGPKKKGDAAAWFQDAL